jgi:hypothetical protein
MSLAVVMPVFNGERHLDAALASIFRQTHGDFELIVVDDGSTDGTGEILRRCRDPRLRVVRNETNLGLPRALNRALAAARGALVARHDADDVSHPERFARQIAFLRAHPEVALLGTAVQLVDGKGRRLRRVHYKATTHAGIDWQLLFGNPFTHGTVMFRREVVERLGGYDESFEYGEDFELWSRIVAAHRAANLGERLVDQRIHARQYTGRRDEAMAAMRRRGMARYVAVCRRNMLRILGGDAALAEAWPEVRVALEYGVAAGAPPDPARVVELIAAIRRRFDEIHPETRGAPDIRRHRAWLLTTVACKLASRSRRTSLRAFMMGAAASPRIAAPFVTVFVANALVRSEFPLLRRFFASAK